MPLRGTIMDENRDSGRPTPIRPSQFAIQSPVTASIVPQRPIETNSPSQNERPYWSMSSVKKALLHHSVHREHGKTQERNPFLSAFISGAKGLFPPEPQVCCQSDVRHLALGYSATRQSTDEVFHFVAVKVQAVAFPPDDFLGQHLKRPPGNG